MRVIDADKLKPDCMTKDGRFAISQSQIANAKTIQTSTDAVSRQAVLDLWHLRLNDKEIYKAIYDMPSVTPIQTCDDAVSRQAVLEMAYDMSEIDGEHFTEPWMVVDVEDIQKLPPVTPTHKSYYQLTKEAAERM